MRAWMALVAVATLCLGLAVAGCQQAQETPPAEQAGETMMQEGEEQMAMVDPVCGMEVSKDSEWTAEYEGETYYFCSEQCRDTFMAEPGTYMQQMHDKMMKEGSTEDMPMEEGMHGDEG